MDYKKGFFSNLYTKITSGYEYFNTGVWKDPRNNVFIRIVKTLNLTVRTFSDTSLQNKSMALTYSTVLAIVPGFAMLLAIGRGFGLQNIIQTALYSYFPAQHKAVGTALTFVDAYLDQASKGVFVGIGIVLLLWTLIALLSNIEEAFNNIWGVRHNRSFYQKATDYISIIMMVPVLMICSFGVAIFVSTVLQDNINLPFLTPLINSILEITPLILVWLAFTLSYYLIPNTKVSFKYAAVAGLICAVGYQIVQLLFVNGQIYVSKYNAIYGSFSFLPLLLIWLQLSWLILLFGCVLSYSMQNVFGFNYLGNIDNISENYIRKISLLVTIIIYQRFSENKSPITKSEICLNYDLPIRLVNKIIYELETSGIIYPVTLGKDNIGYTPAKDFHTFTVANLFSDLDKNGESDFIPDFNIIYKKYVDYYDNTIGKIYDNLETELVAKINIPSSDSIKTSMQNMEICQNKK